MISKTNKEFVFGKDSYRGIQDCFIDIDDVRRLY